MARAHPVEARDKCESAFSFLVKELGYRRCGRRYIGAAGFEIDYCGPGLGVRVYWYLRDPLTVWLVRTRDRVLPPTVPSVQAAFDYLDLTAVIRAFDPARPVHPDFYGVTEESAATLAADLRACAPVLLNPDHPALLAARERVRHRARREAPDQSTGPFQGRD